MSSFEIRYVEAGRCNVTHLFTGTELLTDTPPEYGGRGRSFSATDLVAVALGTCIATSIDKVAVRHELDLRHLSLRVEKELSTSPKRIAALRVAIHSKVPVADELQKALIRAAETCPVKKSLHPDIAVEVRLVCRSTA